MLKCWILLDEQPIGWAMLRPFDPSMGVIGGTFQPLPAFEAIRPLIYETNLRSDLTDQPPMIAQTEAGERLDPVAGVKIMGFPEVDELEVTVVGLHWEVIQRHFGNVWKK